jgi:hypothetical protein
LVECCIRCNFACFSQDCNGGSYETVTDFMADLFSDGGDGILQFQDGTTALTSAQWSELDTALAKAPQLAASPASSPAPSPVPASTSATGKQPAASTGESSWCLMHSGMAENPAPAWNTRTGERSTLRETSELG